MDAPTTQGVVEVIDTVGDLKRTLNYQAEEITRLGLEQADLLATIAHLKTRKAHYKSIAERIAIVIRAARLLDVSTVGVEVIEDAVAGDEAAPSHPFAQRFGDPS
jgi:hypothetical protein